MFYSTLKLSPCIIFAGLNACQIFQNEIVCLPNIITLTICSSDVNFRFHLNLEIKPFHFAVANTFCVSLIMITTIELYIFTNIFQIEHISVVRFLMYNKKYELYFYIKILKSSKKSEKSEQAL